MSDKIEVLDFGLTWALVKGSDAPPIDPRLHALLNENGVVYLHKSGGEHDGWIVSKDPDGGPDSPETIAIARKVRGAAPGAPYAPGPELDAMIAELERLDREASPAPWTFYDFAQFSHAPVEDAGRKPVVYEMAMRDPVNGETIVAARNALPRLLATIRALCGSRSGARR